MTEFKKTYTSVDIGEKTRRHRVIIEDLIETVRGSVDARIRYFRILDMLITTPDLATVGSALVCDHSRLSHDGMRWILEMEAVTSETQ